MRRKCTRCLMLAARVPVAVFVFVVVLLVCNGRAEAAPRISASTIGAAWISLPRSHHARASRTALPLHVPLRPRRLRSMNMDEEKADHGEGRERQPLHSEWREPPGLLSDQQSRRQVLAAVISSAAMATIASKVQAVPSSVYAPSSTRVDNPPTLPQSALLNSLPLTDEIVGEIQAYLESFVQVLQPTPKIADALARNDSLLWSQLRSNAQRALEICELRRPRLSPVFRENETSMLQTQRAEFGEGYLYDLTVAVRKLVNASFEADSRECAKQMENALTCLVFVADGLVRGNATLGDIGPTEDEYLSISRLIGRASVHLSFERKAKSGEVIPLGNMTVIVDGYNYPVTAGNFIDLCKRRFYDGLPMQSRPFESTKIPATRIVAGLFRTGFTDPLTGRQRTIPLEVLRQESNGTRYTLYGAARNTAVFTKARPLLSFRTRGAIGMLHPDEDANGGSAAFFWIRSVDESLKGKDGAEFQGLGSLQSRSAVMGSATPSINKIDGKFAIFGFIVAGLDLTEQLQPGDVLSRVTVEEGVWQLLKLKTPTFTEILFRGDSEEEAEPAEQKQDAPPIQLGS